MPNFSNLSITIRRCPLFASTIIGYARVMIDNRILLKEIPVFHCEGPYLALLQREPVAVCPPELDMDLVNDVLWSLRDVIELAIMEEVKKLKAGMG